MTTFSWIVLFCSVFVAFSAAKDLSRTKRQLQVYYMCNGGVSQYPCNNNNNCNNCNNYGSYSNSMILPTSFYNPSLNCNSGCNNVNCNSYNGQWLNGQYVAYSSGSNTYSPCASSCCSSNNNNYYNPYNSGYNSGNLINNNFQTSSGNGYSPYSSSQFTGTYSNGMYLCGGSEPSGGTCQNNGICPSGHSCVAGNVCCKCPVGASAGSCSSNTDCRAGYTCSVTGNCCASQIASGTQLETCINGFCPDGQTCGIGNLCYPQGFF